MDAFLDEIVGILPPEAKNIDTNLLILVFSHLHNRWLIPAERIKIIRKKYGTTTYESLEFLGDGILEAILKHMIYQSLAQEGPAPMSRAISLLRSNNFLSCLAGKYNLCLIESPDDVKYCADIFEALLGAVFLHLTNQGKNAYRIMYRWLVEFWEIPVYLGKFLTRKDDMCFTGSRIQPPRIKASKLPVPVKDLPEEQVSPADLLAQARELEVKQLEYLIQQLEYEFAQKSLLEDPERALGNIFRRLGFPTPRYILLEPNGIGISCPQSLCPEGGFLAISQEADLVKARREVALEAIHLLEEWEVIS